MENNPLQNTTFVFTGELSIERSDAQSKVILLGGRVTTQPSSKTDYLVIGTEPGPSKLKKAKELNIKIINELEFFKLIGNSNTNEKIKTESENKMQSENNFEIENNFEMWSEKYRPKIESEFVGNQVNINKLRSFLSGKENYKAVLLSGNPGIGKTTAAIMVSNELNLDLIELNASDVRNKGELDRKVKGLTQYASFGTDGKIRKKVLLMDEIDGMTSDRGGITELTNIIKESNIPIICVCNDRTSMKIKTLSNHCLDLRFRKLEDRQILPRIKEILKKENKQMKESMLKEIIHHSNGDIRYILNTIQTLLSKEYISTKDVYSVPKKTILKGLWGCVSEMFSKKSVSDKIEIYFEDYEMIPLMIQENYLKSKISLKDAMEASDSISFSDIIDGRIKSNQDWNLLPSHAIFNCILPSHPIERRIDFSSYLGNLSKTNKNKRNLFEITVKSKIFTSAGEMRSDIFELFFIIFTKLMLENKPESVIEIFQDLNILDFGDIWEIMNVNLDKNIGRGIKNSLTRMINKIKKRCEIQKIK